MSNYVYCRGSGRDTTRETRPTTLATVIDATLAASRVATLAATLGVGLVLDLAACLVTADAPRHVLVDVAACRCTSPHAVDTIVALISGLCIYAVESRNTFRV